jgi:hypothetical protein
MELHTVMELLSGIKLENAKQKHEDAIFLHAVSWVADESGTQA